MFLQSRHRAINRVKAGKSKSPTGFWQATKDVVMNCSSFYTDVCNGIEIKGGRYDWVIMVASKSFTGALC